MYFSEAISHPLKFHIMLKRQTLLLATLFLAVSHHTFAQQSKIILSPYNTTVSDALVGSLIPDENRGAVTGLNAYAWTQGGAVNITRPMVKFDFSQIPQNGNVLEAKLVLYFDPFSTAILPSHMGSSGFYVSRIIEHWDELGVTWNNQPDVTTEHQVYVPAPSYSEQNFVIDVTDMVNDMLHDTSGLNEGFMMTLENESPYNAILLCSRENADESRHPKMLITFEPDGMSPTNDWEQLDSDLPFTASPNPATSLLTITAQDQNVLNGANFSYQILNTMGQVVKSTTNITDLTSTVNISLLPAGTYVIVIASKDQKTRGAIRFKKV